MKNYPTIQSGDADDIASIVRYIVKERKNDVQDFTNLTNIFMSGRKSGKIPSGAADISSDDRVGDFNYTSSFLYLVVDTGSGAAWRRVALSTF